MGELHFLPETTTHRGDLPDLLRSFVVHLRSKNAAKGTIKSYQFAAQLLIDYLCDPAAAGRPHNAADIKRRDMEAFFAWCMAPVTPDPKDLDSKPGRGSSPITTANYFRSIQQWFRWMADPEEDIIDVSPMANMKAPSYDEKPVPIVRPEDFERIFATCGKDFYGRRDEVMIRLFLDTGARLSELLNLSLDDLDMQFHTARVLGKGGRYRDVSFGVKTAKALDRYLRVRRAHPLASALRKPGDISPALWIGRKGPLTDNGVEHMLTRRVQLAGINHIHPHMFRHTFAHMFRRAGGQQHDLMRLGGWKSERMARRYGESAADEEAREAHRRFSPGDRI